MVFWEQNPHLKSNQNPDVNTKGFVSGFGSQNPIQIPLYLGQGFDWILEARVVPKIPRENPPALGTDFPFGI